MKATSVGRAGALLVLLAVAARAQQPVAPPPADTTATPVQDRMFTRPFIAQAGRTAVGGYVEGNATFAREDGVSEGFNMELRRFNIFLFSNLGSRIRFISELEFEHGTEEIALETALLDVQVNPSFVLRGGIILPPIGAFNVNHDSPRWDFVDRPLVATMVIPSTLSEVGFGAHGRLVPRGFQLTYDAYLVNGLGDGVILNGEGRTSLAAGRHEERFGEDNNGLPAFSGRLAAQHAHWGELGLSHYRGTYNSYRIEGDAVDAKRGLSITALDLATAVGPLEVRGEAAYATIQVPSDLADMFADRQWGFHLDLTMPVWKPRLRAFPEGVVSADLRLEAVDLNAGRFATTGGRIGDETQAFVLGASYRPVPGAVLKLNWRRAWITDLRANGAARLGVLQAGFATYF